MTTTLPDTGDRAAADTSATPRVDAIPYAEWSRDLQCRGSVGAGVKSGRCGNTPGYRCQYPGPGGEPAEALLCYGHATIFAAIHRTGPVPEPAADPDAPAPRIFWS